MRRKNPRAACPQNHVRPVAACRFGGRTKGQNVEVAGELGSKIRGMEKPGPFDPGDSVSLVYYRAMRV